MHLLNFKKQLESQISCLNFEKTWPVTQKNAKFFSGFSNMAWPICEPSYCLSK